MATLSVPELFVFSLAARQALNGIADDLEWRRCKASDPRGWDDSSSRRFGHWRWRRHSGRDRADISSFKCWNLQGMQVFCRVNYYLPSSFLLFAWMDKLCEMKSKKKERKREREREREREKSADVTNRSFIFFFFFKSLLCWDWEAVGQQAFRLRPILISLFHFSSFCLH